MKYKKNDIIIYPLYGVCKISEISLKKIKNNVIECYEINPVFDSSCHILVPTNNKAALEKIKPLLTRQEVYSLIESMPLETTFHLKNTTLQKKRYEEILGNNNRQDMVRLIKTLYQKKQSQNANGRKLHTCDEEYLQTAERMINDEISYVLGLQREEARPFILQYIEKISDISIKKYDKNSNVISS